MFEVRQTTRFAAWLLGLRDERAMARILKRLDRAREGNLGDVAPVGEGVSEMRIFYGPGYLFRAARFGADRAAVRRRQVDTAVGYR